MSPFIVIASGGSSQSMDASPRGGEPGFIKVRDEKTLLIPDAPGNNRLDTLENILATGKLGILFMSPGVDETLRVNGSARLMDSPEILCFSAGEKRTPKLVIEVTVAEAYLHCAKALMRSKLWDAKRHIDRRQLPSAGEMLKDQTGSSAPAETQDEMIARYTKDL